MLRSYREKEIVLNWGKQFILINILYLSTHFNVFLKYFFPGPFGFKLPSLQVSGGRATQRVEALVSTLLFLLVGFLYLVVTVVVTNSLL